MIPIVDARSGQVVQVGKPFGPPGEEMVVHSVAPGVFSACVDVTYADNGAYRRERVRAPIKWWPRFTYGPEFPVDATRVVLLPT